VVRRCVCVLENLVNEDVMAHWGAVAPKTNKLRLPWVQQLQQFVFKDRLSEDREREREIFIGVKVVFCILICEYVIRINL